MELQPEEGVPRLEVFHTVDLPRHQVEKDRIPDDRNGIRPRNNNAVRNAASPRRRLDKHIPDAGKTILDILRKIINKHRIGIFFKYRFEDCRIHQAGMTFRAGKGPIQRNGAEGPSPPERHRGRKDVCDMPHGMKGKFFRIGDSVQDAVSCGLFPGLVSEFVIFQHHVHGLEKGTQAYSGGEIGDITPEQPRRLIALAFPDIRRKPVILRKP